MKCRFFNFYEYYDNWTSSQRRQLFERLYCCHVVGESSLLGHMHGPEIFNFSFSLHLLFFFFYFYFHLPAPVSSIFLFLLLLLLLLYACTFDWSLLWMFNCSWNQEFNNQRLSFDTKWRGLLHRLRFACGGAHHFSNFCNSVIG